MSRGETAMPMRRVEWSGAEQSKREWKNTEHESERRSNDSKFIAKLIYVAEYVFNTMANRILIIGVDIVQAKWAKMKWNIWNWQLV